MSAPKNKKKIRGSLPGQVHETGPGGLNPSQFAAWYRGRIIEQWRGLDLKAIERVAEALVTVQETDRQVFVIGNGGSAATASHIATDLSKTASTPGHPQLRCLSLTDNVSLITAIGNDLSFGDIFSRQLENLLKPEDIVILISGSGNSKNLLRAAEFANERGALTVGLLGFDGGKLARLVKIPLLVPSDQYGVIEDIHIGVGHILTFYLKQRRSD